MSDSQMAVTPPERTSCPRRGHQLATNFAPVQPQEDMPQAPGDSPTVGDLGEHPVAVLSSAVLTAVRHGCDEDQASFAARAGVALDVVAQAEDCTRPAWALPYGEFVALADAVAACCLPAVFETAAACDLLLTCVLNGDRVFATDVLVEPRSRELAWALLRLAITGDLDRMLPGVVDDLRLPDDVAVLSDAQVATLRRRAAALATSLSPDAWAGAEILAACRGGRS
jgi:hypothetical protein